MSTKYNILSASYKSCQLIFYKKYIFLHIRKIVNKNFTLQIQDAVHQLISQTLELKVFLHGELAQYLLTLMPVKFDPFVPSIR